MEIVGILAGVAVAVLVIWTATVLWRHYTFDERPVRLNRMLGRLGLSVEGLQNSDMADHLPTAARICLLCGRAGDCDRVLESDKPLSAPPEFCPNGGFIRLAKDSAVQN